MEIIFKILNLLPNAEWLQQAADLIKNAPESISKEDMDKLAEILIIERAKYLQEQEMKTNPEFAAKTNRISQILAQEELLDEAKNLIKPKNEEN